MEMRVADHCPFGGTPSRNKRNFPDSGSIDEVRSPRVPFLPAPEAIDLFWNNWEISIKEIELTPPLLGGPLTRLPENYTTYTVFRALERYTIGTRVLFLVSTLRAYVCCSAYNATDVTSDGQYGNEATFVHTRP